jgi:hypothetical protein
MIIIKTIMIAPYPPEMIDQYKFGGMSSGEIIGRQHKSVFAQFSNLANAVGVQKQPAVVSHAQLKRILMENLGRIMNRIDRDRNYPDPIGTIIKII